MSNNIYLPVTPLAALEGARQAPQTDQGRTAAGQGAFAQVLQERMSAHEGVRLSRHAEERMAARNVHLSPADMEKLGGALDRVRQGGGDRSLVLLDQVALVASARNNTVITAVPRSEAGDNVFTDIDSAVIVQG